MSQIYLFFFKCHYSEEIKEKQQNIKSDPIRVVEIRAHLNFLLPTFLIFSSFSLSTMHTIYYYTKKKSRS